MYHANPSGVYQTHRVGMMLECRNIAMAGAAFMHLDDKGHNALKNYAALNGLMW